MSQEEKTLNFDNALQAIEAISNSFTVDAWVPSKKKYYSFKEIDANQQKKLLSSAMNSSVYNTNFVKTFYSILDENFVGDEKEELKTFTIFDKASIALALKSKISKDASVIFDEDKNNIKKINITPIIEKFKNFQTPESENVELKNEENNIKLGIFVPTVGKELDYEEEIHKKEKRVDDIKNTEDIQKILSEAFVGETSKYIHTIHINDTDINFDSFDFSKKIKIVEKLPSGLIQKILEIVSKWKKEFDEILTVEFTENEKTYKKVLSIDSLLFLS